MLLRLPNNLHYPITIIRVVKRVGDAIKLNDDLFMYSYVSKVKIGQRNSDVEEEVDKKFVAHFPSSLEGTITTWRRWEGDTITEPTDLIEVEEECTHAVQFSGMCTDCGKVMSAEQDTERATIQPLHDTQYLTISQDEANRVDEEAKKRLLANHKLSLVVDLDQTIIHAAVDPTIAEWQKDVDNPNHEAVKDVRSFQLIDEGPSMRGCWYYIKLRPGLQDFLEHVSEKYELHIYTMGTRQYAQQIALIVDPDKKYFGDRILSRDESGSMVAKNLGRLFPVDTKMVVIIDDRGDVWKWSPNLIRVTPFDFFPAIGDINSSFLPKKEEIKTTSTESPKANGEQKINGGASRPDESASHDTSALGQLAAMSSDDPAVREMQSEQEEVITSQLEDKPLLKMQQQQDEQDEINGGTHPTESDSSESETEQPAKRKARHSILNNDDEELVHLEDRLAAVHTAFFSELDRKRSSGKIGRIAELSGKKKAPIAVENDLDLIPDVKRIMPAMKMRVLAGVTIVFSGVLPLGTDIQTADISTWAKSFGATIADGITDGVTHVIAAKVGTVKVKKAVKRGIKVVGTNWLIDSMQRWRKLDERAYLLTGLDQDSFRTNNSHEIGTESLEHDYTERDGFLLSSEEDEASATRFADTDEDNQGAVRKKLRLNVTQLDGADADEQEDEASPITIDQAGWEDMDAELAEFMGSEVDSESDGESVASGPAKRGSKRRRDVDDSDDESLARERDEKRSKGSALKTVAIVPSNDGEYGGTNTPDISDGTGIQQEENAAEHKQLAAEGEEVDSDDELARELERELEEQENASDEDGLKTDGNRVGS